MEEGSPTPPLPRKSPIRLFVHGVGIEPLAGGLGLGHGLGQGHLNRAANTALSQFTDAATMGNCWMGLHTERLKINGGKGFIFGPGQMNKASNFTGDDIRKSFMELKPAPANGQLLEMVDRFQKYAQTSMQAPEVLSGEPGKSGETYRGLSARIEQATMQLGAVAGKHARTFVRFVLINNAELNAVHLPENEMMQLMDWDLKMMREVRVQRQLYEQNYRVEIRADLRFVPEQQRVDEANMLVALSAEVPELAMNPRFRYESIKKLLAARKQYDMIRLLGEPPPVSETFIPPQPPMQAPPGAPSPPPQEGQ
jgi:hypothetical protein